MSAEQNTAVLRKYFEELWNKGNLALINELVAPKEDRAIACCRTLPEGRGLVRH